MSTGGHRTGLGARDQRQEKHRGCSSLPPVPCSAPASLPWGGELPVPLPAPAALLTGARCRPQRPWGSSSLHPYAKRVGCIPSTIQALNATRSFPPLAQAVECFLRGYLVDFVRHEISGDPALRALWQLRVPGGKTSWPACAHLRQGTKLCVQASSMFATYWFSRGLGCPPPGRECSGAAHPWCHRAGKALAFSSRLGHMYRKALRCRAALCSMELARFACGRTCSRQGASIAGREGGRTPGQAGTRAQHPPRLPGTPFNYTHMRLPTYTRP